MGRRPLSQPGGVIVRITGALLVLAALLLPGLAAAQTFPQLTGPVVDAANVIPDDVEARMTQKLLAFNKANARQLQVATVPDLQGYDIADYGYQLGRAWGIGDKERNDGAILLVAPTERKVRIEVGYGLESTLTDALSSQIIRKEIVPRFKAGDMPGGIEAGTDALITQLQLPPEEAQKVASAAAAQSKQSSGIDPGFIIWLIIFVLFFVLPMIRRLAGGRRYHRDSGLGPIIIWNVLDGMSRGGGGDSGSSWGGGGGGGWSGGGGGFGGGGSSGSW